MKLDRLTAIVLAVAFAVAPSNVLAAINITGNVAAGGATFEIEDDLLFNITAAPTTTFIMLVFDGWTTSDGVRDNASASPSTLTYSLNAAPDAGALLVDLEDNLPFSAVDVTVDDGALVFLDPTVLPGDTLEIRATIKSLGATPGFNPLLNNSIFTGDVFVANRNGLRISNILTVPEPTSLALLGLGGLMMLRRRTA